MRKMMTQLQTFEVNIWRPNITVETVKTATARRWWLYLLLLHLVGFHIGSYLKNSSILSCPYIGSRLVKSISGCHICKTKLFILRLWWCAPPPKRFVTSKSLILMDSSWYDCLVPFWFVFLVSRNHDNNDQHQHRWFDLLTNKNENGDPWRWQCCCWWVWWSTWFLSEWIPLP